MPKTLIASFEIDARAFEEAGDTEQAADCRRQIATGRCYVFGTPADAVGHHTTVRASS